MGVNRREKNIYIVTTQNVYNKIYFLFATAGYNPAQSCGSGDHLQSKDSKIC